MLKTLNDGIQLHCTKWGWCLAIDGKPVPLRDSVSYYPTRTALVETLIKVGIRPDNIPLVKEKGLLA